ncbi:MAG TPA: nicotinate phosphoribosyltransferase [Candidatus Saccharimonadales bacterium]|nr:nicotinate phosphoribosyltransferase [Candidatus Saccharimonadales bacterium]
MDSVPHFNPGGSALLTDLYQLTMAYGYWKSGKADQEAVFHLFFRKNPFQGGFTLAAGLADVVTYLQGFRFEDSDLAYLASLQGRDQRPLFGSAFLDYLRNLRLTCSVDAMPEGTVVFPYQPLLRVQGPILQAQLIETALLNLVNFQSLIATKAARICLAAQGDPVVEFGLRRAHGTNGAMAASRAAFVGGCSGTSNVLAGKSFGIPVKGTHAHSWVMSFPTELEAFNAYADAMPNNCIFLVDTFGTLEGVRHAVEVAGRLRKQGHELAGIRLDSGDLAYLSIEARKILDQAGFPKATIIASNDLDEHLIESLKQQGARIDAWGVGTKLVTGYDQPALGGVYKLTAIRGSGGAWEQKVKLSEQKAKVTTPGILQVRRFYQSGEYVGDALYDIVRPPKGPVVIVDPLDPTRRKHFAEDLASEELLVPILRDGEPVAELPSLEKIRARAQAQLARLSPGIKRFANPHQYPAGLELGLHEVKTDLVLRARGEN